MSHILTLPNQYELNSMSSYSGSYTDNIFYGNMFSKPISYLSASRIPNTENNSLINFQRSPIASTISNDYTFLSNSFSKNNKTLWLSDYLNYVYGRYVPSRTSNFCIQVQDYSEYYYDSYVPDFFEIYKINSGSYVGNIGPFTLSPYSPTENAQFYSGSRKTINGKYVEDFDLQDYGYGNKANGKTDVSNSLGIVISNINMGGDPSSSIFANVQDNEWTHVRPYSYKYKKLERNFRPNKNTRLTQLATYNLDGVTASNPLNGVLITTFQIYTSGTKIDSGIYSSSFTNNNENIQQIMDMVISGSEAEAIDSNIKNDPTNFYTSKYKKRMTSYRMKDALNVYFGLGKNGIVQNQWSDYGFLAKNSIEFLAEGFYTSVAPVIRGYKYGIYKANPTTSKAYWRRGKYGQFRDRLEQRLYSKYRYDFTPWPQTSPTYPVNPAIIKKSYNPEKLKAYTGESIVTINFVSGTESFLYWQNYNNWNPETDNITTLSNSYGSGMFDFEYKATQPFIDRDI